ncbi:MAG TPA: hypothetical protein VFV50_07935, partial [Bdellovibrionales bacterium]|nr:hypothetical protein [Bdellovibrionales bacterium]
SKTIFDLYPSNQHENAREGLKHIVQTGYYQKTYTAMIDREHKLHFVDLASSSVHDDAGNFVCTVTISRVLENHELEKVLDSQEYFTTVSRKRP